eukprot:sb/3465712/
MRVLQWNLRKMVAPAHEVQAYLTDNENTIALITEPPMRQTSFMGLPVFPTYTAESGQRACVVVTRSTARRVRFLPSFSSRDVSSVIIGTTVYCAAYWPHDASRLPPQVEALIEWSSLQKFNIVMCGDFNAKHHTWDKLTNRRGISLRELVDRHRLTIVNEEGIITREQNGSSSVIDLSIVNLPTLPKVRNWERLEVRHGSDHYPISFEIESQIPITCQPTASKINMETVTAELTILNQTADLSPATTQDQLDNSFNHLLEDIEKAEEKGTTTHPISKGSKTSKPWFTKELRVQRSKSIEAEKKYNSKKSCPALKRIMKKTRKHYLKTLKKNQKGIVPELLLKSHREKASQTDTKDWKRKGYSRHPTNTDKWIASEIE